MAARAPTDTPGRPLRRAALWLLGLGAFFYASYGFTNWLAGQRASVPSIVFDWERHIPFIGWTIFPYWTTNLFYAGSLLLARTRNELDTQARRLLSAQLVAIACFALFPLKFSWPKPEVSGFFAFFYEALGAFDKPFNQAPSLHVALSVILVAFYFRLLGGAGRIVFAAWTALVIVSVLTTYQHHFIDIPLGLLLGLGCVWLWPFGEAAPRVRGFRLASDPDRLRLFAYYALGAVVMAGLAYSLGGAALWIFWPAVAMALVALAYLGLGPALFGKSGEGRLDPAMRVLLAPYLAGAFVNSRLWTRNEAPHVAVGEGVHLGRYPDRRTAEPFGTVIDLTAEMSAPGGAGRWQALPMLDLVAPEPAVLRAAAEAIEAARQAGTPVLVCCALGYGRSVAALIVWLVRTGRAADVEAAFATMKAKRPRMAIGPRHRRAIEEALDAR